MSETNEVEVAQDVNVRVQMTFEFDLAVPAEHFDAHKNTRYAIKTIEQTLIEKPITNLKRGLKGSTYQYIEVDCCVIPPGLPREAKYFSSLSREQIKTMKEWLDLQDKKYQAEDNLAEAEKINSASVPVSSEDSEP